MHSVTKSARKSSKHNFVSFLLDNDIENHPSGQIEKPNANVNLEYGLMLGHNKYVIPFQRETQKLPFNVAGLDTVKYTKELAGKAIDHAIKETSLPSGQIPITDQTIMSFCLTRGHSFSPIDTQGDKDIFNLGDSFGFKLLISFNGLSYIFLGIFTTLHTDAICWRLDGLKQLVDARLDSIPRRIQFGMQVSPTQQAALDHVRRTMSVWVIVTGQTQRDEILLWAGSRAKMFPIEVFTLEDVREAVGKIGIGISE